MRVLALIEGSDHVCYRYRLKAYSSFFAQENLFLDGLPLRRGAAKVADLLSARTADVVILQRKLLPAWQFAILRRAAKYLVYDIDDALFRRDSFAAKPQASWQRLGRFRMIARAADLIFAGNSYLAQFASSVADSRHVHVVPTCIDPSRYEVADHGRNGSDVRMAWIGQASTVGSLVAGGGQLAAIGRRLPGAELHVICDSMPQNPPMKSVLRPWSAATEASDLAATDIGISWLCDDLWSLGKCGLKVLQYMAAGLPVVANPVGIHRTLIVPGETGFLAETPEQWAAAVACLANDPELRRRMGAAARRRVEADYNVSRWGPRIARLLRGPASPATRRPQNFAEDACEAEVSSRECVRL